MFSLRRTQKQAECLWIQSGPQKGCSRVEVLILKPCLYALVSLASAT